MSNLRLMSGALVLSALALRLSAQSASTSKVAAPPINEFTVAGVRVIHKLVPANDVIAIRLYIRGGSAAQSSKNAGIERLMAMVSGRGTQKYTGDEFAARATATGARFGFDVSHDFTALTGQGVKQHWNETWDLFTQAALHPTFPADEVEQSRGQLLNALKQRADDPDEHLGMLADSVMYSGHAYAVDPLGTPASIASVRREDLAAWHRSRMNKANLLLVVVGNLTRAQVRQKVAASFGSLPARGRAFATISALPEVPGDLLTVKQELPTNYIMGVYPVPGPASPDFPAVRVATRILSERLFEEVRTKRNLTYAVSSGIGTRAINQGTLYVTAVDPDTTIKVILSEVRRLQREPVPIDRLKQSINVFATGLLMNQQTNMGQAAQLGMWEISGGGWENAVAYIDRLRKVTPAQVQQAAMKYMKNARFVVIGDPAKIQRGSFLGTN